MYRSTFDVRREQTEPEDEITEEVPRPNTRQCEADGHSWKLLESPHDNGTHQCSICRLEGFPKPAQEDRSTCNHNWKYLSEADKRMKRTSFHMGQRMISNAPMPDADCTKCSMVLYEGEACYWSPFGRVARPWNGN